MSRSGGMPRGRVAGSGGNEQREVWLRVGGRLPALPAPTRTTHGSVEQVQVSSFSALKLRAPSNSKFVVNGKIFHSRIRLFYEIFNLFIIGLPIYLKTWNLKNFEKKNLKKAKTLNKNH